MRTSMGVFCLSTPAPSNIHAGNLIFGDCRPLGRGEAMLFARPTKFSWSVVDWRQFCRNANVISKPTKPIAGPSRGYAVFSRMTIDSYTRDDPDDMFDDLFKKYGKVVFRRKDQNTTSAEIDDDAESLSFAMSAAKVAREVKAADIRVLFVKPLVYWTRFFIIATAFSRPQIDAIGSKIKDLAEKQYGKVSSGDSKPNSWTLLDFGDVVVHIFLPQQRAFYNLEEFYGNATSIELPFENQPPFRN